MATIGTLIDGKYEVLKLIGKGGMSKVYLAMDKNLNKQWAIKEIQKQSTDKNNDVIVASALAEANMMKKLDHPCLPRIVDILDGRDVIYVVMDYIEGEPLGKVLERQGAIEQDVVIEWAKDLCGVLDYLHMQEPAIIYRDMKPANIMLQPNGNIKLIDFGIAREYKERNLEDTVSLGTKGYAAPEQFGGMGQTDARTDIYCLGVTLYHLLTGKNPCEPPYEIYPIRYWNPELSSGLESIILKCTQLNPEDRYQTSAELLYALDNYEKADDAYRFRQKRKLGLVIGFGLAGVISLMVGIFGQVMKVNTNNNNYASYLLTAEKSSSEVDKLELISKAINTKPETLDAYLQMVGVMKENATFTTDEESVLLKNVRPNLTKLQNEEGYGDLAYEVGKLYWYYYDYGNTGESDNQITRMKSASEWFKDACLYGGEDAEYYTVAQVYMEIGDFNKNVTLNVQEASDNGTYKAYFENLSELNEIIEKEDNEIANLEVNRLIIYAIENYARKFKADEITKEEINDLFEAVSSNTRKVETTTEKTSNLKAEIIERTPEVEDAINKAFEIGV